MSAKSPQSSWRATAGPVLVCKLILLHQFHILMRGCWGSSVSLLCSSGFYELSDGGSCSRSNSCTSVYSECLSSSQTSLVPMSPVNCHKSPPPQVSAGRRRSADESPLQPNPMRPTGVHLGSSRIRASAAEKTRPRPVSTGTDLSLIPPVSINTFRFL